MLDDIASVKMYVERVMTDLSLWGKKSYPWFRGQPVDELLVPTLFRDRVYEGNQKARNRYLIEKEHNLIQLFKARSKALDETPKDSDHDEWLFLMQHFGVPTRLLDWTEGALIALYFAVYDSPKDPVVWMIDPHELNQVSIEERKIIPSGFPPGINNFQISSKLEKKEQGFELPLAILTKYIHRRMSAQKSCFTVHGLRFEGIDMLLKDTLVANKRLIKYNISKEKATTIISELSILGITYSTLFPDLDGLGRELRSETY